MTTPQAAGILRALRIRPSSPIHPDVITANPQVVEVWFQPKAPSTNVGTTVVVVVNGTTKLQADAINWAADAPTTLTQVLAQGGRVLIRVHCGHLMDAEKRVFSGSVDGVTGFESEVRAPGGVFESWFFVRLG